MLKKIGWDTDSDYENGLNRASSNTIASGLNGMLDRLQEVNQARLRGHLGPNTRGFKTASSGEIVALKLEYLVYIIYYGIFD